jgi:hypothetical protein
MRYTTLSVFLLTTGLATFAADTERALPIFFIPNTGQTDPAIRYIAQTPQLRAGFAPSSKFKVHSCTCASPARIRA